LNAEVEFVVSVASDIYSKFIDAVSHLLSFEDLSHFRRGKAISGEYKQGIGILEPEFLYEGIEVDES